MKTVCITGTRGFIGEALADDLTGKGYKLTRCFHRHEGSLEHDQGGKIVKFDLYEKTDWSSILNGIDTVIHLAARVHIMQDAALDPLTKFRKVNTEGTLNLARQAAASGVRRFIYLSTVKVNGEQTALGEPYSETDSPNPRDAYAISKYEAEKGLIELASTTNLEIVIVRPPLVYGPKVKANFKILLKWIYRGLPLPLASIYNKRSLIGLENLIDFLNTCIEHPSAANELFLVSDGVDLSTTELLHRVGEALHTSARLFSVPPRLLEISFQVMGKGSLSQRLLGSLQVNIHKANTLLGWEPPYSIEEGLKKTAEDFLRSKEV